MHNLKRDRWLYALILAAALLAGLFSGPAKAAPPCYPWDSDAKNLDLATIPASLALVFANWDKAGYTVSWYCDVRYGWKHAAVSGWTRNLEPDYVAQEQSLTTADKPTRDALWTAKMKCADIALDTPECLPYAPLRGLAQRLAAATIPAAIIWQVKDNPTGTSRPVYAVGTNGSRNTVAIANARISDVTTVCSCMARAIEESGGTYCQVTGAPNVSPTATTPTLPDSVAICARIN